MDKFFTSPLPHAIAFAFLVISIVSGLYILLTATLKIIIVVYTLFLVMWIRWVCQIVKSLYNWNSRM